MLITIIAAVIAVTVYFGIPKAFKRMGRYLRDKEKNL